MMPILYSLGYQAKGIQMCNVHPHTRLGTKRWVHRLMILVPFSLGYHLEEELGKEEI